ncbi:unnamed protein product, partial [Cuscuta europaea]
MEQSQLQKAQADEALILARKQLQEVQEAFRLEKEAFGKILENSKVVAIAEGRAEAEKTAAVAVKKATEDAEGARNKAVTAAREDAIAAFVSEGWNAEGRQEWVASVVEASVDSWVKGPGAMWLAWKGKEYYDGG